MRQSSILRSTGLVFLAALVLVDRPVLAFDLETLSVTVTPTAVRPGQPVTVTEAAAGLCEYRWAAADVDTPGLYDAAVKVLDGAGKSLHTERFLVRVVNWWED